MMEKTYQTGRGTIHYWVNQEEPSAVTLVFLPGLTADHRLFEPQLTWFQDRYQVLVWDAPGHGASRPFFLNFSLMDKAEWLRGLLAQAGASRPVLIGQSMGGYVAQCYLERYPGEAAGFVAIDSAPLQRRYVTAAELWGLRHCEGIYRIYPWKALVWAGTRGCSETERGRALMADMMSVYSHREYSALAGHGFRMLAEAMAADLPYEISCPALLLCGEHDKAGSAKRYNIRWAEESGLPLIWVKGAGHNSNYDGPEQVNEAIQRFLTRYHLDP